jgi:hypothetical protein
MFSAGVWGDIWSKEISHLDVTGGTEEEDGTTQFLMWEFLHELKLGDRLRFDFERGEDSSRRPEVSGEIPDDSNVSAKTQAWPPSEEEIVNLEARPHLNPHLAWRFSMSQRAPEVFRPGDGRQHLSFGLLWNNRHPERIRVSLTSASLREIVARTGGHDYITDYVPLGSHFELDIGA